MSEVPRHLLPPGFVAWPEQAALQRVALAGEVELSFVHPFTRRSPRGKEEEVSAYQRQYGFGRGRGPEGWVPKPDWKQGQKNVTKGGNLETYAQDAAQDRGGVVMPGRTMDDAQRYSVHELLHGRAHGDIAAEAKTADWWQDAHASGQAVRVKPGNVDVDKGGSVFDHGDTPASGNGWAGNIGHVEKQGMLWHATHADGTDPNAGGGKLTRDMAVGSLVDYHNQRADEFKSDPRKIEKLEVAAGLHRGEAAHGQLYDNGAEEFSPSGIARAKDYLAHFARVVSAPGNKYAMHGPALEDALRHHLGEGWSEAERDDIVHHAMNPPMEHAMIPGFGSKAGQEVSGDVDTAVQRRADREVAESYKKAPPASRLSTKADAREAELRRAMAARKEAPDTPRLNTEAGARKAELGTAAKRGSAGRSALQFPEPGSFEHARMVARYADTNLDPLAGGAVHRAVKSMVARDLPSAQVHLEDARWLDKHLSGNGMHTADIDAIAESFRHVPPGAPDVHSPDNPLSRSSQHPGVYAMGSGVVGASQPLSALERVVALAFGSGAFGSGVRHVRTPEGVLMYHAPIGTMITDRMREVAKRGKGGEEEQVFGKQGQGFYKPPMPAQPKPANGQGTSVPAIKQWIPQPAWKQGQQNVTDKGNLETWAQDAVQDRAAGETPAAGKAYGHAFARKNLGTGGKSTGKGGSSTARAAETGKSAARATGGGAATQTRAQPAEVGGHQVKGVYSHPESKADLLDLGKGLHAESEPGKGTPGPVMRSATGLKSGDLAAKGWQRWFDPDAAQSSPRGNPARAAGLPAAGSAERAAAEHGIAQAAASSGMYTDSELDSVMDQIHDLQDQLKKGETKEVKKERAKLAADLLFVVAGVVFASLTFGFGSILALAFAGPALIDAAQALHEFHVVNKESKVQDILANPLQQTKKGAKALGQTKPIQAVARTKPIQAMGRRQRLADAVSGTRKESTARAAETGQAAAQAARPRKPSTIKAAGEIMLSAARAKGAEAKTVQVLKTALVMHGLEPDIAEQVVREAVTKASHDRLRHLAGHVNGDGRSR